MDLMQLLTTEQTERAKKQQHKAAFQSYKQFEFLKAGILTPEEQRQQEAAQK